MEDKKLKRLEYLRKNIDYLSIRERQEYNNLRNEYRAEYGAADFFQENQAYQEQDQPEVSSQQYQPAAEDDFNDFEDYANETENSTSYDRPTGNRRRAQTAATMRPNGPSSNRPIKSKSNQKRKKKHHWIRGILILIVVVIAVMAGFFVHGYNRGVKHEGGVVKAEKFTSRKNADGSVNILLLGADKRPGQSDEIAHTDSIMVLHLSKDGKQVRLVSFMRDTLVNIPGVASYNNQPNVKINAAFTIGEQNSSQGVDLMSQTLKQNFGVNIQYYAVVDFSSFATVIDSLFPNGVKIDAKFSTINHQKMTEVPVPDDLAATEGKVASDKVLTAYQASLLGYPDGGGTFMMIKQGEQKMDGRTLLNYARFRHDDEGDFGRVKRQQQVMSTIMGKLKNPLSLFTGASAIGTARAVTMTNVPNTFLLTKGISTMFSKQGGIQSVTIPSTNDWSNGYDKYGGLGLVINMTKYRAKAEELLGQ